jgi:acyl-CoA synthetase (AMP-forming)/AMP-acid ligase II
VPAAPPSSSRIPLLDGLTRHGDQEALVGVDGVLTYSELARRVGEVGERLGGGRRLVLLAAENSIDGFVHHLGALAAGHVVLLTNGETSAMRELTDG